MNQDSAQGNTNPNITASVADIVRRKRDVLSTEKGIKILFPNWEAGNERVAFVCGHDDDALAGSAILINYLTNIHKAQVYLFVATSGDQGYYPEQLLKRHPDLKMALQDENPQIRDMDLDTIIMKMRGDARLHKSISAQVQKRVGRIRQEEAAKAYDMVGVPSGNIIYFSHNDRQISDTNMDPYMCLETLDGQSGLYKWLIEGLRDVAATRLMGINPGDTHMDHQKASYLAVAIGNRARSNMPHLGKGAPLKINAAGTHGLYYLTYENMPEGMGVDVEITSMATSTSDAHRLVPMFAIEGTMADAMEKHEALKVFESQPGLVPVFGKMPDNTREYYHPFPSADRLMRKDNGYTQAFDELFRH